MGRAAFGIGFSSCTFLYCNFQSPNSLNPGCKLPGCKQGCMLLEQWREWEDENFVCLLWEESFSLLFLKQDLFFFVSKVLLKSLLYAAMAKRTATTAHLYLLSISHSVPVSSRFLLSLPWSFALPGILQALISSRFPASVCYSHIFRQN